MQMHNACLTQQDGAFAPVDQRMMNQEPQENQVPASTDSPWQRVIDVILVDGQIRYLVERSE